MNDAERVRALERRQDLAGDVRRAHRREKDIERELAALKKKVGR